ncbi:PAS domain S-box [Thioflavicoccus mobilis 8321]|uniref:PAS domain S-box n=1 Tax=Thioflavicoccus mobilis 8321 TaxID=765912 RepID=L0H158_9GAMM|nr:PAS domain S-box [Thioflavicoccus mobilis 8321]
MPEAHAEKPFELTAESTEVAVSRYRTLLEQAPFGIVATDRVGRIVETSPSADRLMGVSAAQHRQRTIDSLEWSIVNPAGERLEPSRFPAVRAWRTQSKVQGEIVGRVDASGETVWLSVTAAPVPGGRGEVLVVYQDVTRQHQLESMPDPLNSACEAEQRFRAMAEGLPVIVWIAKPDGTREFFNRHYADFLGLAPEEVTGREHEWRPFIHPDDVGPYLKLFRTSLRQQEPFEAEFRGLRQDCEWRWVKSNGRPWWAPNGEYMGLVGATLDITERKRAELALKESNARLREDADMLARLASQLVLTEQRERQRFGHLLHDRMQQDLIAVKFKLHSVLRDIEPERRQPLLDAVALVDRSIDTSRNLHTDLSPAFVREANLHVALTWLAETFERNHGLRVETDLAEDVMIEREDQRILIFEAVREALLNVVKHARVDRAEVRMQRGDGGLIQISVEDRGAGFDQAPNWSPALDTNGLRTIEERLGLMGGGLRVESRPGVGTRVVLLITEQAR